MQGTALRYSYTAPDKGSTQVIVTDLTDEDMGIPVIRLLVPGLESWSVLHSRVGMRAASLWRASQA